MRSYVRFLRLGYLCCTTLAIFLALEGAVRALHLAPPLEPQYAFFVPDPVLPYRTAPNAVFSGRSKTDEYDFEYRHNRFGYRDVEHSIEKPAGVYRILGLGDSFTYGAGAPFEDTYLRHLETLLNTRRQGPRVEIIKAGIPRFFPKPERLLLEHEGRAFQPDLILVGFVPNDVMDTYMGLDAVTVDETGYLKTDEAAQIGRAGTWLYLHSHVFRILLRAYITLQLNRQYTIDWPQVFQPGDLYEAAWQEIESEYSRMVQIAREMGAEIAFVHIPISPYDAAYYGITDLSYPARRLRQWAERENVLFIDTLPAISQAQQTETLYWKKDSHCNSRGYQVIAETLFAALTQQAVIPSKTFTESSLQFHAASRAEAPNRLIIDSVRSPSNDVPKRLYQPTD